MQAPFRRIIALCGSRTWAHASVRHLIGHHPHDDILWTGDIVPEGLNVTPYARRQQILGEEYGVAVIDAWAGFDPDIFGAVSGTVRGGGILLLVLPKPEEWVTLADPAQQRIAMWPHTPATMPTHFVERTIRVLRLNSAVEWLFQDEELPPPLSIASRRQDASLLHTADQQRAIEAINHVMHGHRRRPLVLMADRGRGKSASLGIAAANLLEHGELRIIVTAPHQNAVASLFARISGPATERIRFIPPDELLRHPYICDLLLVDEAAAIPAPMLEQLLHRHSRIVFATTVHGYEGSGRGFALRFFKTLDTITPGWSLLEMKEPIRWSANDPLERLTYDLLLLDAGPASDDAVSEATVEHIHYEIIQCKELANNDALLSELFGLLVLAHYRTTPLDLRQLLDSPNLAIHVARYRDHIVGIALTLREGGFDSTLAREIYSGERRPRGHLAPQSLAFHCGLREAPLLITERIMRIAVHPAVQRRGIGAALVKQIHTKACGSNIDYLSTSFGATSDLLSFWQSNTFMPVRIGITRDASSGTHSALLLRPLSPAAMKLFIRARTRFLRYLPVLLGEPLNELDPDVTMSLMSGELIDSASHLDEDDWNDLLSFAITQRSYESCLGSIYKLTLQMVTDPLLISLLTSNEHELLIAKVLQHQAWSQVCGCCQTTGKDQTVKVLRQAIKRIVEALVPERLNRF